MSKCATCQKYNSDKYFTCMHDLLGFGFQVKGQQDKETVQTEDLKIRGEKN